MDKQEFQIVLNKLMREGVEPLICGEDNENFFLVFDKEDKILILLNNYYPYTLKCRAFEFEYSFPKTFWI